MAGLPNRLCLQHGQTGHSCAIWIIDFAHLTRSANCLTCAEASRRGWRRRARTENGHELVCVSKYDTAPHTNTFELGQHGRYRTNVWDCGQTASAEPSAREPVESARGELPYGRLDAHSPGVCRGRMHDVQPRSPGNEGVARG